MLSRRLFLIAVGGAGFLAAADGFNTHLSRGFVPTRRVTLYPPAGRLPANHLAEDIATWLDLPAWHTYLSNLHKDGILTGGRLYILPDRAVIDYTFKDFQNLKKFELESNAVCRLDEKKRADKGYVQVSEILTPFSKNYDPVYLVSMPSLG